jgi:hypothetical protein
MVLYDGFTGVVNHHDRKLGHDAENLRLGSQTKMPPQLREFLVGQALAQVQHDGELKDVSHSGDAIAWV